MASSDERSSRRAFHERTARVCRRHSTCPHHLVDGGKPQLGHDLAQLLGHEHHVVDHVLGLAGEAVAQTAILRGDAHRAGILLAIALHEATHRDERHGGEAELLGTEQAGDGDVAPVHELAVGLEDDTRAQAVLHERLLRLG